MARIFTYSVQSKVKAFYVDLQMMNRLDEFYKLLKTFEELQKTMAELFDEFPVKATRLIQLTKSVPVTKTDEEP